MRKRMLAGCCAFLTAFAGIEGHLNMTDRAIIAGQAARIGDINLDGVLDAADAAEMVARARSGDVEARLETMNTVNTVFY